MPESLARRLARFAAGLTYEAIPPEVIDKAKASLAHCLVMSSIGAATRDARRVIDLTLAEEASPTGATILVDGGKATRLGAAFANTFIIQAQNQADSYHMLVHPAACVVPAVLVTAELDGATGSQALAAMIAATEVECRMAGDFLPSTQARGFRSSPLYGAFGAAIAAASVRRQDEEQMLGTIAWANAFASGLGDGAHALHEANATRAGVHAAMLAEAGFPGFERSLDGPAGFYNAFTGNADGKLAYSFGGFRKVDLSAVADDLGERWEILHVTPKVPPTAGYMIPVQELVKKLRREHGFQGSDVASMQVLMNWLETTYPSPTFVDPNPNREPQPGTTAHAAAYVCLYGDFPIAGLTQEQSNDPAVLDLMRRTEVLGVYDRVPFAPRITVELKDGRRITDELQGNELEWDFETELTHLRAVFDQIPTPNERLEAIVDAVAHLEDAPDIRGLIALCVA